MTHTNTRFPTAIKVRLPATVAAQLEELASTGVLNLSDHVRLAIDLYLRNAPPASATSIAPPVAFVDSQENR